MPTIDWKRAWKDATKDSALFPIKSVTDNTYTVSCPTRFSDVGSFSIDVTPHFNDEENSIEFEILYFNDAVSLDDLKLKKSDDKVDNFNSLAAPLLDYEINNRLLDRFTIKSDGFSSHKEAVRTLVDYINNKATESGHMFDNKLDELNNSIKEESYIRIAKTIKESRKFILKKVESILRSNFKWKASKNEDFSDSTTSLYDQSGNLAAVVSLVDNFVIVDLAKDLTAKVSILKSDEEIADELVDDVNAAQEILADRELDAVKDAINNQENQEDEDEDSYLEKLNRKITKLESLYIRNRLNRIR